ncbi:MAG: SPFH domain-containing protein [archaeon]
MDEAQKEGSKLEKMLFSAGRITKKGLRAGLICSVLFGNVFGLFNLYAKWVYQVKTNYGVVITQADGERVAITESGWHMRIPLLSTYENDREQYALANQVLFLDGKTDMHEVIARDEVTMAAAVTYYEITDLRQYAIENVKAEMRTFEETEMMRGVTKFSMTPRGMLQKKLDSIIGTNIQKTEQEDLIHNRGKVEDKIFQDLLDSDISKRFGIKFNGFNFSNTSYMPDVVKANAEKQTLRAIAEGKNAAAEVERKTIEVLAKADANKIEILAEADANKIKILAKADANKYYILEKALNPQTPEEKKHVQDIFRALVKYKTIQEKAGSTVWVVPDSASPIPTYNPGSLK